MFYCWYILTNKTIQWYILLTLTSKSALQFVLLMNYVINIIVILFTFPFQYYVVKSILEYFIVLLFINSVKYPSSIHWRRLLFDGGWVFIFCVYYWTLMSEIAEHIWTMHSKAESQSQQQVQMESKLPKIKVVNWVTTSTTEQMAVL